MKLADFLHGDTDLGKQKVNFIIIGWVCSKMAEAFKGNAQFIFLCNQKSAALRGITFLQITQKILTNNIFHWLEMIPEILSFLQIFSVRKTATPLF